jgi:hypothetical protein
MAKNLFNTIKLTNPKSNAFDLTHDVKLSLNMGELIPIMCTEAVPGDKFKISGEALVRLAPLISPMMHRLDVSIHYFFVPNRILWDNWEKWIVNKDNNEGRPHPYILYNDVISDERLSDYLGLPKMTTGDPIKVNAFPFAAYQCIYNEYYRDQNLIPEVDFKLIDGDNTNAFDFFTMRKRAWEHDYFTSCLPWAQKGEAVDVPISGKVSLVENWVDTVTDGDKFPKFINEDNTITNDELVAQESFGGNDAGGVKITSQGQHAAYDPVNTLEVKNSETTINDLRRAYRLQEWLEKNARAGTRYVENILAHFGVKSSDARLQRPEYITGIKSPVVISEVLSTSGSQELPQGNMAGHGVSVATGKFGSYYCEEHGFLMGIMSVMPKTAYQQGIPRKFLKVDDPFQYFWPTFAHIGEQEVFNSELYADTTTENQTSTFGYVPRYAEYKFENNRVAGDFKTTLNYWHMGRIFAGLPALNQTFIDCVPTDRVFAVEDPEAQKLYAHVLNKVQAIRKMPKYGTPTF